MQIAYVEKAISFNCTLRILIYFLRQCLECGEMVRNVQYIFTDS